MATGDNQHRPSAGKAFAILASVFALLFGAVVALLAFDQYRVLAAAERLQHEAVPEIIRFQRLARSCGRPWPTCFASASRTCTRWPASAWSSAR